MVLYWKESSNILFHFILITYVLKFLFLSFLILFLKKPLWRVCDWVRGPIYASGPWDSHILVSKMGRQVGAFWALALECFLCIPSLGFNARSPNTNFEKCQSLLKSDSNYLWCQIQFPLGCYSLYFVLAWRKWTHFYILESLSKMN